MTAYPAAPHRQDPGYVHSPTIPLALGESGPRAWRAEPFAPTLLGGEAIYRAQDRRWVHGPAADALADHVSRYGPRPITTGHAGSLLVRTVESVGLAGRGGAHFPVAAKWRTALDAIARGSGRLWPGGPGGAVVVANGAEGEPAAAKDTALLQHRPHLVIDGLVCLAEVVGATQAVIWLHEGADETHGAVARALAERRAAGLPELAIGIAFGPDRYLSGEANAVTQALDGGPAVPRFRRYPAAVSGVGGLPTLVHNVETLARTALLARVGSLAPPPGALVSVLGRTPADDPVITVREVAPEASVAEVILDRFGHWAHPRAVLIGGYGGSWYSWDEAAALYIGQLDRRRPPGAGLDPSDATLGAGVLAALPVDACGVAETAAVADYLASSSARQCGPCVFGTRAVADLWSRIADGRGRGGDLARLEQTSAEISRRGACALPDAVVGLTRSALRVFRADIEAHVAGDGCGYRTGRPVLPLPGRGEAA